MRVFSHQIACGVQQRRSDLLHIEIDAIKNRALIDHKHCELFENFRELLNGLR